MPNEQGGFEAARLDRDAAQDVADVVAYPLFKIRPHHALQDRRSRRGSESI